MKAKTHKNKLFLMLVLLASIVLILLILHGIRVYIIYRLFSDGCGFDDGPFFAQKINSFEYAPLSESYKYEEYEIIVDNRAQELSPILHLFENGEVKWIYDLSLSKDGEKLSSNIWNISELLIDKRNNKLEIQFLADWSYGLESGFMTIDLMNGDTRICLSW